MDRHPSLSRFSELAERVVGALASNSLAPRPQLGDDLGPPPVVFADRAPDSVLPRFASVKHGYDPSAVDQYVTELEAELGQARLELRALQRQAPSPPDIAAEIERLGEQTSAILITAHDTATEQVTLAQTEAGTRIADAAAYAAALREEAKNERHRVEVEIDRLRRDRGKLIGDIEATVAALSAVASEALAR